MHTNPKILIVSATETEIAPLKAAADKIEKVSEKLYELKLKGQAVSLLITGVGIPNAMYEISSLLARQIYDRAFQIGIAGSFNAEIVKNDVVYLVEDQFGDVGIEKNNQFNSLFEAGFSNPDTFPFQNGKLSLNKPVDFSLPENLKKVKGLTVNMVTSSKKIISFRREKFEVDIETMESAAFFYCCIKKDIPFLGIRAISNVVGEEDRSDWTIKEAILRVNETLKEILIKNNFFHQ